MINLTQSKILDPDHDGLQLSIWDVTRPDIGLVKLQTYLSWLAFDDINNLILGKTDNPECIGNYSLLVRAFDGLECGESQLALTVYNNAPYLLPNSSLAEYSAHLGTEVFKQLDKKLFTDTDGDEIYFKIKLRHNNSEFFTFEVLDWVKFNTETFVISGSTSLVQYSNILYTFVVYPYDRYMADPYAGNSYTFQFSLFNRAPV